MAIVRVPTVYMVPIVIRVPTRNFPNHRENSNLGQLPCPKLAEAAREAFVLKWVLLKFRAGPPRLA